MSYINIFLCVVFYKLSYYTVILKKNITSQSVSSMIPLSVPYLTGMTSFPIAISQEIKYVTVK